MAEQETTQEPVTEQTETSPEVSLEDVYSEFNVTPELVFREAPAPESDDVFSEVQILKQELAQIKANEQKTALEKDIEAAVSKVSDGIDADPLVIEAALDAKARKDPRFQAVWNNRHSNPVAYEKALTAFKGELAKSLRVKESPQIAETLAAIENSNVTAPNVEEPNKYESMGDGQFISEWRQLSEA